MEYVRGNRVLVLKVLAMIMWGAGVLALLLLGLRSIEGQWEYAGLWAIVLALIVIGIVAWLKPSTGWKAIFFMFMLTQSIFLLASGLLFYLADVFQGRELQEAGESRRLSHPGKVIRLISRITGTLMVVLALLLLLEDAMIGLILIAIVVCLLFYSQWRPLTGGRSISLVAVLFFALPAFRLPLITEWYNNMGLGALAFFPGLMLLYVGGLLVVAGAQPSTQLFESRSEKEGSVVPHKAKEDEEATYKVGFKAWWKDKDADTVSERYLGEDSGTNDTQPPTETSAASFQNDEEERK